MAGNTILLQFLVDPSLITDFQKTKDEMYNVLKVYIDELSLANCLSIGIGGFLLLYTGDQDSFVTVRVFADGVISINIEYFRKDGDTELLTSKQVGELARDISIRIGCSRYETFPPLRRGPLHRFTMTTDERLIEHNIDRVVFKEKSPYQQVTILHSASYGNMLFLDGWVNYSSTDRIYTESLIQRGKEDYRGKEILILGGGDGAILCELLKENPKFILMIDIDEVVIRACRIHMRDVHGGVLDFMKGPNYEVVVADCVQHLRQLIKEGRKFDYVIGDLTDIPISDDQGKSSSFIRDVINLSLNVMKPTAKYMCHCEGHAVTDHLKDFESTLQTLDKPVDFSSVAVYVPSFLEFWNFYQIWRKNATQ